MRGRLGVLVELIKPRIVLLSCLSSLAGAAAASGSTAWAPLSLGVWLTAAGACALNQCQEREADRLMARTRGRPLPSGRIRPKAALALAAALLACGPLILLLGCGRASCLLAAAAALWYNGVYTPLKGRSAFSAAIGALTGALGPAIGWAASGKPLADARLGALCFFFLLWQVPHSWLLSLRLREEYEGAGFPTPAAALGREGAGRLLFCWSALTALSALLLPLYGVLTAASAVAALAGAAAWTLLVCARLYAGGTGPSSMRGAFATVNGLALAVLAATFLDRVF